MLKTKDIKVSLKQAKEKLKESNKIFKEVFRHGTLNVEIYKPSKLDLQQAHTRDEIYVIASGTGKFYCDGTTTEFEEGDFLFVPAGKEHWFEDFSKDFMTWVFFYGPEGGEREV